MFRIEKYYLVDWGSPANEYSESGYTSNKEIYMTSEEAQIKNNELVELRTTLRYVKANPRKLNKKNDKVK
jgi:hypothetical protein